MEELQRAVVDAKDVPADVIMMNSRADMLDLDGGETISLTLVFPPDVHIEKGKISVLGGDGARMLHYCVRDEFEWNVADDYGE